LFDTFALVKKADIVDSLENGLGDFSKESRREAKVSKDSLSVVVSGKVVVRGY